MEPLILELQKSLTVRRVMWVEGWERGERGERGEMGEDQRVGQLLPDWEPGWMGIHHHD
jgi:hypothetical protein